VISLFRNIENACKILNREPHKKSLIERARRGWDDIKWKVKKYDCKDANSEKS
jgi:hypothetical protein